MKPLVSFTRFPLFPLHFKAEPIRFAAHYRGGSLKRSGAGITGFLFKATDALVSVPLNTVECPFSLACTTSDHQSVTVQGICTFRVVDPAITAAAVDFTVTRDGTYASDDPDKLPDRLGTAVAALVRRIAIGKDLMALLASPDAVEGDLREGLEKHSALGSMGMAAQGVSVTRITPAPEIAQALEARKREAVQQEADKAIHDRQMGAEAQDRALKQQQILTQQQIQEGEREVMEARMATQKAEAVREKELQDLHLSAEASKTSHGRDELRQELEARLARENEELQSERDRREAQMEIATAQAENRKILGAAEAHTLSGVMEALSKVDPKVLQSLALRDSGARGTIATAFLELAERAGTIGNLNITPDLLSTLLTGKPGK